MISKQKIALIGYKLSKGGAERVLSNLSIFLHNEGYEVHIITMIDEITFPYSGKLFNVGAFRNQKNDWLNKFHRYKHLKKYLKKEKFDWVVDFRFRIHWLQELLIYNLYPKNRIQTVHSGVYQSYLFKNKWLSKWCFSKFRYIVCVSKAQQELITEHLGFSNTFVIPNAISLESIQSEAITPFKVDFPYFIFVGRIDKEKQLEKLLNVYLKSDAISKKIHFVILGKGDLFEGLKEKFNHPMIHFIGYQPNPFPWINHAKALLLSSKFEGFGMVLVEANACGIPTISFDCFCGPNEIIKNGFNGFLVKNQDWNEYLVAINKMIISLDDFANKKTEIKEYTKNWDWHVIGKKWISLLNQKQF
jgi:glycosyltransferase involved in cell wall biosynthesis